MRIRSPHIPFLFLLVFTFGLFACVPVYRVDDAREEGYRRGYALAKSQCEDEIKIWRQTAVEYHNRLTECLEAGEGK